MIDAPSGQDNQTLFHAVIALSVASLPALGWMARKVLGHDTRITTVETQMEERTPLITEIQRIQVIDGNRLVMAEASLAELKALNGSAERQFAAINAKLECLPRIEEALLNLSRVYAQIVPREEWELNNKMLDERMNRIENRRAA